MFGPVSRRGSIIALCLISLLPFVSDAQEQERRTGEWQQFTWSENRWMAIGTFLVREDNGVYLMTPVTQVRDPSVTNSRGLFDVSFTSSAWTFRSDWGNGNIANFRLTRTGPGTYEGWSYLGEERRNKNMWLLVK